MDGDGCTEFESKGPSELSGGSVKRRSELPAGEVGNGTMGRAELDGERTGHVHELPTS